MLVSLGLVALLEHKKNPRLEVQNCFASSPTPVRRSRISLSASHVGKAPSPIAVYQKSGAEASCNDRFD
jgi:hypothetical protein